MGLTTAGGVCVMHGMLDCHSLSISPKKVTIAYGLDVFAFYYCMQTTSLSTSVKMEQKKGVNHSLGNLHRPLFNFLLSFAFKSGSVVAVAT